VTRAGPRGRDADDALVRVVDRFGAWTLGSVCASRRGARGGGVRARARGGDDEDAEDADADADAAEGFYEDDDADDDDDEGIDDDDDDDDDDDVISGRFARSMYDDVGVGFDDDEDAEYEDEEDAEEDDSIDYDDEDEGYGTFGDIDLIAGQVKLDEIERDVPVEKSRHFTDEDGNLRGRALYICQLNWWLRVKNMQTYPPSKKEIAELVERTGVAHEAILAWYDDQCEKYDAMSISDRAAYEADIARRQEKVERLVAEDFAERSMTTTVFLEEDIFYDEADLMSEYDMSREPLTLAMERLDDALREDEMQERLQETGKLTDDEDDGLDDSQLQRIYQDGSSEHPFLINPKQSPGSDWRLVSRGAVEDGDDVDWVGEGGWDALPQHEAVSAFDGGSLSFVGVQNEEIESGENVWMRERALNTRHLAEAREVPLDTVDRDPKRHFGDTSRIMHHTLKHDQVLKGTVVALDLYHGALIDCGTEIDALLPINESDWMTMRDHVTIGMELEVRVSDLRSKWWRFRYPLEVMPTRQDLLLMMGRHPHPFGSPINIYAGESWDEACIDAGRKVSLRAKGDDQKQLAKEKLDAMIKESAASNKRKLSVYEIEMLESSDASDEASRALTKKLEARLAAQQRGEDVDDEFDDDDDDELFDDDLLPLANEDLDEDEDEDDIAANLDPVDEVSTDLRGGSVKIRDEFHDDDEEDEDDYAAVDDEEDEDEPYAGAR